MARLESTMVDLGTEAPAFHLPDVLSGQTFSPADLLAGEAGLLLMFVCAHCPYVQHIEGELGRLGRDFAGQIGLAAIQPTAVELFPEDGPDGMRSQAERNGWSFPYLLDESQSVARNYNAVCTPDLFLFDRDLRLVYRGQLDPSRPRRSSGPLAGDTLPVTGEDLRRAIADLLAGRPLSPDQRPGIGCSIKWRA